MNDQNHWMCRGRMDAVMHGAMILALALFMLAPADVMAEELVNYKNVTHVTFGKDRDQRNLGSFKVLRERGEAVWQGPHRGDPEVMRENLIWIETDAAGNRRFTFNEIFRDPETQVVRLYDTSRCVTIELNMRLRQVYYSDERSPKRLLYNIWTAEAALVRGLMQRERLCYYSFYFPGDRNTRVNFGHGGRALGYFSVADTRRGKPIWCEWSNEQGRAVFEFVERGYDAWSIYLYDRSRGVKLQLDFHTCKVYYSDRNSPKRAIYDIIPDKKMKLGGVRYE